ncbi:hypothetical protein Vafri_5436 [Volvox africanus]|uniref:Uncharacterized protein n=1 Tax=Volvox africanus TaxID=51714 RepID=A0A8J4AYC5_9CHLO|nr:hypothetical protein Vafri_5436 [Volvox africanus]
MASTNYFLPKGDPMEEHDVATSNQTFAKCERLVNEDIIRKAIIDAPKATTGQPDGIAPTDATTMVLGAQNRKNWYSRVALLLNFFQVQHYLISGLAGTATSTARLVLKHLPFGAIGTRTQRQVDAQQSNMGIGSNVTRGRGPTGAPMRGRGFGRSGRTNAMDPQANNSNIAPATTAGTIPTEARGWIPMLNSWMAALGFQFGTTSQPKIYTLGEPYPAATLANSMEQFMVQDMVIESNHSTIAAIAAAAGQPGATGIVSYDPSSGQLTAQRGPPTALTITSVPQATTSNANQVLVIARTITNPGSKQTISTMINITTEVYEMALRGTNHEAEVIHALNTASANPTVILTNARAQAYGKHSSEKQHLKEIGVPKYLQEHIITLQYPTAAAKDLLVAGRAWNLGVAGGSAINLITLPLPTRNPALPAEGSYLLVMDISSPNSASTPITLGLLKAIASSLIDGHKAQLNEIRMRAGQHTLGSTDFSNDFPSVQMISAYGDWAVELYDDWTNPERLVHMFKWALDNNKTRPILTEPPIQQNPQPIWEWPLIKPPRTSQGPRPKPVAVQHIALEFATNQSLAAALAALQLDSHLQPKRGNALDIPGDTSRREPSFRVQFGIGSKYPAGPDKTVIMRGDGTNGINNKAAAIQVMKAVAAGSNYISSLDGAQTPTALLPALQEACYLIMTAKALEIEMEPPPAADLPSPDFIWDDQPPAPAPEPPLEVQQQLEQRFNAVANIQAAMASKATLATNTYPPAERGDEIL